MMQKRFFENILERQGGFTLLEMLLSMFVFALMMMAVTGIFASGFSSYRNARESQRALEQAQQAIDTMGKYLKTSSIAGNTYQSAGSATLLFFDYSQGKCFLYQVNGNVLQMASTNTLTRAQCDNYTANGGADFVSLTTGSIANAKPFAYAMSKDPVVANNTPNRIGEVTVTLDVRSAATATIPNVIQTTLSLRDYTESGVQ